MIFAVTMATYKKLDGSTPFYLKRALDSIFNQTYQDFKIFVIGDKYEDHNEFLSIVSQYPPDKIFYENLSFAKERDKYQNNEMALWCAGGVYATNHAIDLALQEGFSYICQLDHDDYWTPEHLQNFNDVISETGADWLCSRATHQNPLHPILPKKQTTERYVEYLPQRADVILSSTCINLKTIPIRFRDVFEETGVTEPSDADRWTRTQPFIIQNNLKGILINTLSCIHDIERGKANANRYNTSI
jgi:glycosyltransferase involved in cell wall biosynthesis